MYWSGEDILLLINNYFPQYKKFYENLQPTISKCDFARFIVIALYGGVYIDLDFYLTKNISPLLTGESYFVFEPQDKHNTTTKHICNGFFASYKNNPFILGYLHHMSLNTKDAKEVMKKTGPIALYNYYKNFNNKILFGNACDVIPIIDNNKISKQCNKDHDYYAKTIWSDGSNW